MKSKLIFFLFTLFMLTTIFQACKKSEPVNNVDPVLLDTLSTGWSRHQIAGNSSLSDIFFNTSANGYAVGSNIYKTSDGGLTWSIANTNSSMINIFMTIDNKAFFISNLNNAILKTADDITFNSISLSTSPQDIFFIDNNTGYAITFNGLFNTTDGGTTWSRINTTGLTTYPDYSSLYFINNTGWIVQANGIFKSSGSITNWQQAVVTGGSGQRFLSIYAVNTSLIFAANSAGEIYRSINGGQDFTFIKKVGANGYTDLHFLDAMTGYATSARYVYKTSDGGNSWNIVATIGEGMLGEIHFTDNMHGWVCISDGSLLIFKP